MNDITKLFRRFMGILLLSTILIVILNITILVIVSTEQTANGSPWTTAKETAAALQETESGYTLSKAASSQLKREDAWAFFIDNETLSVKWHTKNLPETIPQKYTISDISDFTLGYIDGYPTYTGSSEKGLIVVGYPRDRFWKHMSPSWDYYFIKNLPYIFLIIIAVNIFLVFLIYMVANSRVLKSIRPITRGIQELPSGKAVHIKETGLLSGLASKINQTSVILQEQKRHLKKKETARANWISGVSHDIRTPLSMVMGYAGQLEEDPSLSEHNKKKAAVIRRQSIKMKNLINDLNLASKLEYNMQPLNPVPVDLVAVARQCTADFMNSNIDKKYTIEWKTSDRLTGCMINGHEELLKRAIGNLITNAQVHNPKGCKISVLVEKTCSGCKVIVEDDGIGITEEKLERLKMTPHYMMSDNGTDEVRHGLGLLIVKQIVSAHKGTVTFGHSESNGFCCAMIFSDYVDKTK